MKVGTAFLIPKKGLMVRDPRTKEPLPATGTIKPLIGGPEGRYWRRRIRDGSVIVGKSKEKGEVDHGSEHQRKT